MGWGVERARRLLMRSHCNAAFFAQKGLMMSLGNPDDP